jgi:HD superfamily phosphohydrolase
MRRLTWHRQLATVSHVYAGGHHHRAEHSIGVFEATIQYVRALYADRRSCFWRLHMERRDIDALLLAALLHDVGHYAFSHYYEDLKAFFGELSHEQYLQTMLRRTQIAPGAPLSRLQEILDSDSELLDALIEEAW